MGGIFFPKNNNNIHDNQNDNNPSDSIDIIGSITNSSTGCCFTCKECFGVPTLIQNDSGYIINQNCQTCINDYYLLFDTNDCYNSSIKELGYYLSSNDSKFHKCDIACSKCEKGYESYNTNCLECNLEDNFYPLFGKESNCFNNETISDGFYLEQIDSQYKWKKCYERCEKCISGGNSSNMNCLSCKNNLMNNLTSKSYYLKLDDVGNCIEYCPDNLYLTSIGDCVESCPNNTYSFSFNHTCLNTCPQNYEKDEDNKKCIVKIFDISTPKNEFKNQILNNITEFVNSGKIVNGSDFIATISYSDNMNPAEQIKNGKSAVDLGNCTQTIKKHYNKLYFILIIILLKFFISEKNGNWKFT